MISLHPRCMGNRDVLHTTFVNIHHRPEQHLLNGKVRVRVFKRTRVRDRDSDAWSTDTETGGKSYCCSSKLLQAL
ncbi:hypothetical protein SCLCIDRAFT_1000614 [Scleroderma citrinum Foug A]|uniref:Uncharacterized protein n=1 Tax=Scleroderma citrinum Foug A TaxID=1036808 RepID=A0A0C3A356_9AGAM|nr:hypothetical protein SCLCIDRAFT_1000614 [Scleroderma citrinum Foug A]